MTVRDEYDSYVDPVLNILREGGREQAIAAYLNDVIKFAIGIPPRPDRSLAAAEAIAALVR